MQNDVVYLIKEIYSHTVIKYEYIQLLSYTLEPEVATIANSLMLLNVYL